MDPTQPTGEIRPEWLTADTLDGWPLRELQAEIVRLRRQAPATAPARGNTDISDSKRWRLEMGLFFAVRNAVIDGLDEHDARREAERAITEGLKHRG